MKEAEVIAAFDALSNATRLRILKALVVAGPDGLSAGDIAQAVEASPSRASFHLSNMSEAGLLSQEKVARRVTYRVDFDAMAQIMRYLLHDCCANHPAVKACC